MTTITPENANLAQFVGKVFGDDWNIAEHVDENAQAVVYVLTGRDKETPKLVSHATIGLSDYELGRDKSGTPLGTELVICEKGESGSLDQALAAVANAIKGQKLVCKPGIIFANALSGANEKSQLDHLMFAVPSMWNEQLYPLQFKTKTVLWLQALPISEAEKQYAEEHGAGKLGEKLLQAKADLTDLRRKSVV